MTRAARAVTNWKPIAWFVAALAVLASAIVYFAQVDRQAKWRQDELLGVRQKHAELERELRRLTEQSQKRGASSGSAEDGERGGGTGTVRSGLGRPELGPADSVTRPPLAKLLQQRPDLRALYRRSRIVDLQLRYTSLFRKLRLNQGQIDSFNAAFANWQIAQWDLDEAAHAQGILRYDPSFEPARHAVDAEFGASVKAVLGETGFAEFDSYQRTIEARGLVSNLVARTYTTAEPLTPEQGDRLTAVIAANATGADGKVNVREVRWDAVLAEAKTFLSPLQRDLLQALHDFDATSEAVATMRPAGFKPGPGARRDYLPKE